MGCAKLDFGYGLRHILSVTGLVQHSEFISYLSWRMDIRFKKKIVRTLCRQQTTTSRLMALVPRFYFFLAFSGWSYLMAEYVHRFFSAPI